MDDMSYHLLKYLDGEKLSACDQTQKFLHPNPEGSFAGYLPTPARHHIVPFNNNNIQVKFLL